MGPDLQLGRKATSQIKERIIRTLAESDGLSISDVSRDLNLNYTTASKYLAVLEAEKRVYCRKIGIAKLFRTVSPNKEGESGDFNNTEGGE